MTRPAEELARGLDAYARARSGCFLRRPGAVARLAEAARQVQEAERALGLSRSQPLGDLADASRLAPLARQVRALGAARAYRLHSLTNRTEA